MHRPAGVFEERSVEEGREDAGDEALVPEVPRLHLRSGYEAVERHMDPDDKVACGPGVDGGYALARQGAERLEIGEVVIV